MPFAKRQLCLLSLLLTILLLLAPFVEAAEGSLLSKLKQKSQQKAEQLQDSDWWLTKAATTVAGFVVGKAGGAIGAGVGYVLGAAVGGPLAAGMGAMLGFRIGDIVSKTFAKAISGLVTEWKLKEGRPVDVAAVTDAAKAVNKKALSAEAAGTVIGDLIGGTLGAAAGIALLAGAGPIVFPIVGSIAAATIGSKLGKAIGGSIGRWIGKKLLLKGYEAYAATDKKDDPQEFLPDPEPGSNEVATPSAQAISEQPSGSAIRSDAELKQIHAAYEEAYREYTDAVTSVGTDKAEIEQKLQKYREAYDLYRSTIANGY